MSFLHKILGPADGLGVMRVGQENARRLAFNASFLLRDTICTFCLNRLSRQTRQYAATAAAVAESPVPDHQKEQQHHPAPTSSRAPRKAYRLLISPVVSRPPLLTRELSAFEKAFYLYQKRLNERLALPVTRYFYYKKGTPGDIEWKRKIKARQTAARDIGVYNAYSKEGWNDEVLVGDKVAESENVMESVVRDAEGKDIISSLPVGDKDAAGEAIGGDATMGEGFKRMLQTQIERPMPRLTEADTSNDTKSLNRKLDRTLYLLVKNKDGEWRFPEDRLYGREHLYQAAERIIVQSAGLDMNTWVVANHPVGHFQFDFSTPKLTKVLRNREANQSSDGEAKEYEQEEYGEKVFFMKTRIMAGQANLAKNIYGDKDFEWLAKEEVEGKVSPRYWTSVRNMLPER